ncbi:hypothetical protein G5V58_23090 [Nocardioides anomalus]|uniref:Right-handed parallel beta-helix repeat-containing protein n=1 Tax=Nocardioides anomalus TaxID=2712223 RepID=A0A6G6WJ74_9ACTN|nr:choice-of-anchor Q domain-containing protein [Nocardioides anomalus]QIG45256.1 hypothetical protein G5V58_23090 [Nocardioides anomalus]
MRSLAAVLAAATAATVAAGVVVAAPAQAATVRYAAPAGSGTACTAAAPCAVTQAVGAAASGDEVVLTPGSYNAMGPISSSASNLNVHGVAGQPRPVLNSAADSAVTLKGSGVRLSDVTIQHQGSLWALNVLAANVRVEHVEVRSSGLISCGIAFSGLLRDSVCVNTAAGGVALDDSWSADTGTLTVRNVTAVATGAGSYGIRAEAQDANTNLSLSGRSVIASGVAADVRAAANGDNRFALVTLATSNYRTTSTSGLAGITSSTANGNQRALPVFADTVTYHQATTSPTVNAGSRDASTGTTDIDGQPRVALRAIDIGADELVPDTAAPAATFGRTPGRRIAKRKATFTFAASEPSTFWCQLDQLRAVPCASPYVVQPKRHGKHTLSVIAVDAAGNVSPPATTTWKWKPKKRKR